LEVREEEGVDGIMARQTETDEPKEMARGFKGWVKRTLGIKEKTVEEKKMEILIKGAKQSLNQMVDRVYRDLTKKGQLDLEMSGLIKGYAGVFEDFHVFARKRFPMDEQLWQDWKAYLDNLKIEGRETFKDGGLFYKTMDVFGREPELAKALVMDVIGGSGKKTEYILSSPKLLYAEKKPIRKMIVEQLLALENPDVVKIFLDRYLNMEPHVLNTAEKIVVSIAFCEDSSPYRRRS
jgi:hypothetical protein